MEEINKELIKSIFFPWATAKSMEVKNNNLRFVHYTSADVAVRILKKNEIWMRNSNTMNDFMEIEYGLKCLKISYEGETGGFFNQTLDSIYPNISEELRDRFNSWLPTIKRDTYLTCISEHLAEEDLYGRLSMWRAYGGKASVALVLNNTAFTNETHALKAYTHPVSYFNQDEFDFEFRKVSELINTNKEFVLQLGKESVFNIVFNMMRFAVMCTKHRGFHEEREWRVVYCPSMALSERIQLEIETINGVPQKIYKIPLKNHPEEGLIGAEIPELLDRIIIGPTQHSNAIYDAFFELLTNMGIADAANKIFISDIPLR